MRLTVTQLRRIIKEEVANVTQGYPAAKNLDFGGKKVFGPPRAATCSDCGKEITKADIDAYQAEGGKPNTYPAVCEMCAEMP